MGTSTTRTVTKSKLRMMHKSLTDKARHSTCRSFRGRRPNPRGESPTADPLLRGGLAQCALRRGSIYTLGRIGARGHIWSVVWKLLSTEGFHWLRCFWRARVAGARGLGHCVYVAGWPARPPNRGFQFNSFLAALEKFRPLSGQVHLPHSTP